MHLILPLSEHHDRIGFDCGNDSLNLWFKNISKQHRLKGISSTFVLVPDAKASKVEGYYSLSFSELCNKQMTPKIAKRLPLRIPVFRIGRLAVSVEKHGKGFGGDLLMDAVHRITQISESVGGIGVVVNAKDDAVNFYKHFGFSSLEDHPNHLFLPI